MKRLILLAGVIAMFVAGAARAKEDEPPIRKEAARLYWLGDMNALEELNARLKETGRFDADGASELEQFRQGLGTVLGYDAKPREAYLRELEALTLQWAAERPKAPLAHIMHANVLMEHGWSYRGSGYAKDVPREAWKDFHAYQVRAVEYLMAHADVVLQDSYAHATLLHLGRALNWSDTQMTQIAEDGLKRNPHDIALYFDMLTALLPKWGGSEKGLDKFIRKAAEQTKAEQGMAMYARLYSAAAEEQFGHALFEDSLADWKLMKQGYEDMLKRYPDSDVRRNRFAYMACLAKDKTTLANLLAQLGSRVEARHWGPNPERSLEGCQRWAGQP